jgi:hypothetical protein
LQPFFLRGENLFLNWSKEKSILALSQIEKLTGTGQARLRVTAIPWPLLIKF